MTKDLFSLYSGSYAKFRPVYPQELFEYIMQFVMQRNRAWDCATGNGQAAMELARYFNQVNATDISESQIKHASQKENIIYSICAAEKTPFEENSFDLITVAQAYHWFNQEQFQIEAMRVGKPGSVIAVWMYHLLQTEERKINELIAHFYFTIMGPYWDNERKQIDDYYSSIHFNFDLLPSKEFVISVLWNKEQFKGYLNSWSSVQHYIQKNNVSPLLQIEKALDLLWNTGQQKKFNFPVYLKMGRIIK